MKKTLLAVAAISLATQVSAAAFDGFYAGVNSGLLRSTMKTSVSRNTVITTKSLSKATLTVGVQTGYAVTFSNSMFAAGEFSLNYDGMARKKAITDLASVGLGNQSTLKVNRSFSTALAAKGGYNFGPGVAYAGAFFGFAKYKTSITSNNSAVRANISQNSFIYGPLVGTEFKVTDTLMAGLEGRMEFARAKKKDHGNNIKSSTKPRGFAVLARLNYAF